MHYKNPYMFLIMGWNMTCMCSSLVRITLQKLKHSEMSWTGLFSALHPEPLQLPLQLDGNEMCSKENSAAKYFCSLNVFQWKPLACSLWIRSWENCSVVSTWWRLIHQTCFMFPDQHHLVIWTLISFLN